MLVHRKQRQGLQFPVSIHLISNYSGTYTGNLYWYSPTYIGKTETTFFERINERAFKDKNSIVCNHINNCNGVKYLADLLNIDEVHIERDKFDKIYNVITVKENISIIDRARRTSYKREKADI